MVATEPFIGREVLRKEDPDLLTGQASYVDNQTMPGMLWMALVRPPYVHATVDAIDTAAAEAMPGVVGVYTAADLELGGLPFVWPITEDIKVPAALPADEGQDPLPRRRRGRGARRVAGAGGRRGRARLRHGHRAPGRHRHGGGDGRGRPDPARGAGHQRHRALGPRWRWGRNGLRHGPGDRARALPPAAADPQRDRASRVPRVRHPGDGRVDARERHADPAHREGHALRRGGHPRVQVPGDRPRRGRRVRLQVERLRRGGPRARPRQAIGSPGEVDRGALGELPGHDPRPRRDARLHDRGHRGRQDPRGEVRGDRGHGRLLPAAHARHPRARRLGLHGAVPARGLPLRVPRRAHELHPDRRVPRRRAPGGHLRPGTPRRRLRADGGQGPGGRAPDEPAPPVRRGDDRDLRPERRLRQLRAAAGQGARAERLRRGAQGAGGPARPRRHAAARHRAQHVHRDVRLGSFQHPGRAEVRGRAVGTAPRSSACPRVR